MSQRIVHGSAVTSRGLLLLGGYNSHQSTELVTNANTSAQSFHLKSNRYAFCVIQLSLSSMVLTGGWSTQRQVHAFVACHFVDYFHNLLMICPGDGILWT